MKSNLKEAAEIILKNNRSSPSFLFTSLKISYQEALNILIELENLGILGPHNESGDREILINSDEEINLIFPSDKSLNINDDQSVDSFMYCEYCGLKQSASNITCDSCFEVIGDDSDQIKSVGDDFDIKNKQHLSKSEIKNILDNNDDDTDLGDKNTESSLSDENDEKADSVNVKNENSLKPKEVNSNYKTFFFIVTPLLIVFIILYFNSENKISTLKYDNDSLELKVDDLMSRNRSLENENSELSSSLKTSEQNERLYRNKVRDLESKLSSKNYSYCNKKKKIYVNNKTYSSRKVFLKYKKSNGVWTDWGYWDIGSKKYTGLYDTYSGDMDYITEYKFYVESSYGSKIYYSRNNPKSTNVCKQTVITIAK